MVDTVTPKTLRELERNRKRREAAEETLHVERERLTALLHRGKREGASIAALARAAGVSRETAHKLLRRPDPAQEDMRGRNRAS
jgi:lambda repressor-like predicted transcriptional regulator